MDRPTWFRRLAALAVRTLLALATWAILVEGAPQAWALGLPLALAAVWASLRLRPPTCRRLHLGAAASALAWFLLQSVAAGFDVALRALRPRMPIRPGFVTVTTRLPDTAARVLLADALTLMPGTLCVALRGASLDLHVLDREAPVEAQVRDMEARIAALWGEPLAQAA